MTLSRCEKAVWNEILSWEREVFSEKMTEEPISIEKKTSSFYSIGNEKRTRNILKKIDNVLFHLHMIVQQKEDKEKMNKLIITEARRFHSNICKLEDMKKLSIHELRYIVNKLLAKQRLYSLVQGGLTGTGGILFAVSDFLFLIMIQLRAIQLVALTYRYDINKPIEMIYVLKLFHAITLPKPYQKIAWKRLFQEVTSMKADALFYEGDDEILRKEWLQQPFIHLLKLILLVFMKRKVHLKIPIMSIVTGAMMNYQFTYYVTNCVHYFYQKRWLMEKAE